MELSIASTKTQARRKRVGSTLLAVLLTCVAAQAAPLQIQLVDQEFSIYTYWRRLTQLTSPYTTLHITNQITSDFPVSDVISNAAWDRIDRTYSGPQQLEVLAESDWSHVRGFTHSIPGVDGYSGAAGVIAMSQIRFTSLNAGSADFDFDFYFRGDNYYAQLIRLRDLTLGQEVWSYGIRSMVYYPTDITPQQQIPYTIFWGERHAQLTVDTLLNTTSTYELTLWTRVSCNYPEREDSEIIWTVPTAIPEPSAWALVMVGLTVTWLPRHRLASRR